MNRRHLGLVLAWLLASSLMAQPVSGVRLNEAFSKDRQYHVQCSVEITGTLGLPANNGGVAKALKVAGKSNLSYDERILAVLGDGTVERTIRAYRQLEFERKVGDEEQHNKLRPEVRRLVVLRRKQYEIPFCPTAPMTWGEVELVRTDVFSPALRGLLGDRAVNTGERWRADTTAIQELTDLERIDKSDLTCTFEKVTTLLGRRNAHVSFEGRVHGLGEDGLAMHELRGFCSVDIDAGFISYVYVKGTHHLLDKAGTPTGKIEGTFVMTRTPAPVTRELSDDALRGLTLEPKAENTTLLFDQPNVGVRFLYPRNWRVAGANEKQIGIDENRGSGVLITLGTAAAIPTAVQFHQEASQFLVKQGARVFREEKPRPLGGGWDGFTFDTEIAKERVVLHYSVTRQGNQGATFTSRILPADASSVQRDLDLMMRTLQLRTLR